MSCVRQQIGRVLHACPAEESQCTVGCPQLPRLGVEICSGRRGGNAKGEQKQGQLAGERVEEGEAAVEESKELSKWEIWKAGSVRHAAAVAGAAGDHVASKPERRQQEEPATHSPGC